MGNGPINWNLTLRMMFLRGWASVFVVTFVEMAFGLFGAGPMHGNLGGGLAMLTIGAPLIGWLVPAGCYATYWLVVGIVRVIPMGGDDLVKFTKAMMGFICTLLCAAGDPLLYVLSRAYPSILPIEGFKAWNWVMVIVVRDAVCNLDTHDWANGVCVPKPR